MAGEISESQGSEPESQREVASDETVAVTSDAQGDFNDIFAAVNRAVAEEAARDPVDRVTDAYFRGETGPWVWDPDGQTFEPWRPSSLNG